ncbi:MAG: TonB-dependent receptor [Sediminibacterium sp.]|nr:TonB-dependent receptor [Sediminibacterium sp.]
MSKKIIYFLLILLNFNLSGYAQDCNLNITGYVYEEQTGKPIGGSRVVLYIPKKQATTNKNVSVTSEIGYFGFSNICKGNYKIDVFYISGDSFTTDIAINSVDKSLIIRLKTNSQDLNEVVVTKNISRISGVKVELSQKIFEESKGQSLANALSHLSGVSTLSTGSTISKPVIRGLHSNRILIINNGVKLEGQQWGTDHAPEVDAFSVQSLSVSKGAANLIFGGDAIGGVVIAEPSPLPKDKKSHFEYNGVFMSNNFLLGSAVAFEQNFKKHPKWSWRFQSSYKRGGNARTPLYYTQNTGFLEWNVGTTWGYVNKKYKADFFLNNFHNTLGIFTGSNYGNVDDLLRAINNPVPINNINKFSYDIDRPNQNVNHITFKHSSVFSLQNRGKLTARISFQNNHRQEFDYAVLTSAPELELNLQTYLTDIFYEKPGKLTKTFGISNETQINVTSGARFFIPNFSQITQGGYVIFKYPLGISKKIEFGFRFDYRYLNTNRNNVNGIYTQIRFFDNYAATFLYEKTFNRFNKLTFNTSLATRAPSVTELFINGLHQGTASFEIGDSTLQSEKSFNNSIDWEIDFNDQKDHFEASIYFNFIFGFINLIPRSTPYYTPRGSFPAFNYVQTNALFTGLDFTLNKSIYNNLSFDVVGSYLLARNLESNDWLEQITPNKLQLDLNYAYLKNYQDQNYIKLGVNLVFKQYNIPQQYFDYLPPPPGYALVSLDAGYRINKKMQLGLSVNNLLNQQYRDYLNRFRYFTDAPGINATLRFKYKF